LSALAVYYIPSPPTRVKDSIKLNENEIKEVHDFTYLGSRMLNTGDGEVEIWTRLTKASHADLRLTQEYMKGRGTST
jgi:hypothetical protein